MPLGAELPTPHTDMAQCREKLSGGSRSFWFASKLLPSTLRNDACGLYAFCREADDAIDEGDDPSAALVTLHQRLDRVYAGEVDRHPTDRVLARVVAETGLPRALLNALLEGFEWDAAEKRYDSLSAVYDYSARVAGAVGVMMSVLMGIRDPAALARAADLGVAMQLTNICRDVGEDARAGRVYLPLNMLDDAGIDPSALIANPTFNPALGELVHTLLNDADRLYRRAESGIPSLPVGCRPGIYAARLLYAGIGTRLRALGYNSIDQRAVLGTTGKLGLLAATVGAFTLNQRELHTPALPECQFLVDAAQTAPQPDTHRHGASTIGDFYGRMVWMLEMIAALEQRSVHTPSTRPNQRR